MKSRQNKGIQLLVVLLLAPVFIFAQKTITGKVVDATGAEIPGASISVVGVPSGTISDVDGNFSLQIKDNVAVLRVSFIGYVTKEETVKDNSFLTVVLTEDTQNIDEVVVIGYGTQKSSRLTNAVAKVKGDELLTRSVGGVDESLIGKISGVRVQQTSGSPGKAMDIKIRGTSSINYSNAPLYVLDGFPVGDLKQISGADIESIEILKDAAAAAIYGSRGANGVVIVTSKQGKKGKPIVAFNADISLQKRFSKYDVMNRDQLIDFAIEERNNTYLFNVPGAKTTDSNTVRKNAAYFLDPDWLTDKRNSLPDNDWQEIVSRTAPMQNYNISVSGATENVKYYISTNYMDQVGIIRYTDYNRLTFNANIEGRANKYVTLGANLSVGLITRNDPSTDSNSTGISRSIITPPLFDLEQNTESYGYHPYFLIACINPVALLRDETNRTKENYARGNIFGEITFIPELKLRSSFSANINNDNNLYFLDSNIRRGSGATGSATSSNSENYMTEHTLSYNNSKIKKWDIGAMMGYSYQEAWSYSIALSKTGFADNKVETLNAASTLSSGSSSESKWNLMSFFCRINATFKDRYMLTASLRRDGCSRFGLENRWGLFPSLSAGWRIKEEEFMKEFDWISNLKLRGSFGVVGNNNIPNYGSIALLTSSNYIWNNSIVNGYAPEGFSNRMLGWERTETTDIGLEMGFLKNRLQLNIDYYDARTKDLLMSLPIPQVTGYSSSLMNTGEVQNRGFEFELNSVNLINKDFQWNTSFNLTTLQNKVLSLGKENAPIYGRINNILFTITEVGKPIGSFYMLEQEGVFINQADYNANPKYLRQEVGDIKYKDYNKDGKIDNEDIHIVGDAFPDFYFGITNTFRYKDFDLSFQIDGQYGGSLLNFYGRADGQSRVNLWSMWNNRWRSEADPGDGRMPRALVSPNMTTASSFFLYDSSYLALRNITLGYSLNPKTVAKLPFLSYARLKFSIDNVFMLDHYFHVPQAGAYANSALVPNVDSSSNYPLAQTVTLGVSLNF